MNKILRGFTALTAALFVFAGCQARYVEPESTETTKITTITVPVMSVCETKEDDENDNPVETDDTGKIPKTGNVGDIKYRVINVSSSGEGTVEKGYYLFEMAKDEYPYKVLVAMGEFSTGGYDICFVGIDYDGSTLTFTVKETKPGDEDAVTQAITYPACAVEFSDLPVQIKVVSDKGYEYKRVMTRLESKTTDLKLIAWFCDGAGEMVRKTYVYETADGTYKYENVTSVTEHWGSSKWKDTIESYGFVKTREEIVEVAKEFHSCGYVMYPNDRNTPHSPAEFVKNKT